MDDKDSNNNNSLGLISEFLHFVSSLFQYRHSIRSKYYLFSPQTQQSLIPVQSTDIKESH